MSCTKMALRSINMLGPPLGSIKNMTNLFNFLPWFSSPTNGKNQCFALSLSAAKVVCSALQETSVSATATETKNIPAAKNEDKPSSPPKRAPAKVPAKALPQLMEEDVIPSLKATLEAQNDISDIELSFQDNKLEGSFLQNGIPYYFWAFFPNGVLIGPKGFSLSSYGSEASTVEPFLIDEKKITAKHVVFWVKKRLAAQGILSL